MGLLQQGRRAHQIHGYEVNFQGTTKGPRGAGVASDFTRRNSPFTGRVLSLFPPPTTAGSPPGSLRLLPTDTHSRPTGSPRAIPADRKLQTASASREAGRPRPTPPPLPPRSPPAPGNTARTVRLLPTDVHSRPAGKPLRFAASRRQMSDTAPEILKTETILSDSEKRGIFATL